MMTSRAAKAHEAKIARWKAMPLPYCVTSFHAEADRYLPMGKRRFATVEEALVAANQDSPNGKMCFVDFAGAYEARA